MCAAQSDNATLIGLGEVLWDIFTPDDRRPGGAPANVAFHATQLGLHGQVASRIGTDARGDELLAYLNDHALDTSLLQRDPDHPTGTVTVHHATSGPAYTIHEDVAWDYLAPTDELTAACRQCAALCFGTLAQRNETSRATIRACLEQAPDAWRVYDVNLRPPHFDAEWVELSLHHCNVAKLNHEELPQLVHMLAIPTADQRAQLITLQDRFDLELLCMTRGAEGCLVATREGFVDVPGASVTVADTVGAGDAFNAALTASLIAGWPVARGARFANAYGGLVASHPGAMPSIRDAARALWNAHAPAT